MDEFWFFYACALNLDERRSRCDAVAVVGLLCIPLEKDSIGACGFAPACSSRTDRCERGSFLCVVCVRRRRQQGLRPAISSRWWPSPHHYWHGSKGEATIIHPFAIRSVTIDGFIKSIETTIYLPAEQLTANRTKELNHCRLRCQGAAASCAPETLLLVATTKFITALPTWHRICTTRHKRLRKFYPNF